jgi:hypothetical protein
MINVCTATFNTKMVNVCTATFNTKISILLPHSVFT